MASLSARAVALKTLRRWRTTREFADTAIQHALAANALAPADRAFVQELFYGILRNLTLLDFYIGKLRDGKLDDLSRDFLRLGLYQILHLEIPAHAAVFETVELAPQRLRPLINGILRAAVRQLDLLQSQGTGAPLDVRESHPQFLITRWVDAFGEQSAIALCRWNNQPPPLYARINTLRLNPDEFHQQNPDMPWLPHYPPFVQCDAMPADALSRGDCYIQDPSTALAVELLEPAPDDTILDACAAPGGKTSLIASLTRNRAHIVACDHHSERLNRLRGNLERLGALAQISQHDWLRGPAEAKFGRQTFDKILVDVPCSNSGVMRRRVDVRWRLKPDDFVRMPEQQIELVKAVLPLLKRGGALVYSTCSLEREENEEVVNRLLRENRELRLEAIRSTLPFRDHLDGAFAARILRVS